MCVGERVARRCRSPQGSIDELSASLGVTVPPDTRIVGVFGEAGIDDMRSAKLEIPKHRMSSFLAATRIPRFEKTDADLLGTDRGFWDPHKASSLLSGDVQLPGARFLLVAYDDSRSDLAVVYVINHGT
jgi:hypothetical protein